MADQPFVAIEFGGGVAASVNMTMSAARLSSALPQLFVCDTILVIDPSVEIPCCDSH